MHPQVGPEGCGKSSLLGHCLGRLMGTQVAMVHCSAQTCAANVIQKLVQVCGLVWNDYRHVVLETGNCVLCAENCVVAVVLIRCSPSPCFLFVAQTTHLDPVPPKIGVVRRAPHNVAVCVGLYRVVPCRAMLRTRRCVVSR
jgi:hypothetical protein